MRKSFFNLLRQDLLLSWRNNLILVVLITAGLIIGLFWGLPLLLPDELSFNQSQVYFDRTEDAFLHTVLEDSGALLAATEKELTTLVEEEGKIGIIADGTIEEVHYSLVFQSDPSERMVRIIKAALRSLTAELNGSDFGAPVEIELLRGASEAVAANESMIAVMLAFEVMILGFLFVAVVVFGEKKEGSIRAYRVSPSGLLNYVLSKTLVFTLMSTAYGLLITLATIGFGINFLALTGILFLSCALMTLLGLGIAAFFNNISEWFVPGVLALSINMLAILPYQFPHFSSGIIKALPGYNVIFGVSEILFPTGKEDFLGLIFLVLALETVVCFVFAMFAVRTRMMKEGK